MPVATYVLALDQGCDFSQTFAWVQGPNPEDALPVDLTGATATFAAGTTPGAAPALTLSTTPSSAGSIVLGGLAGTVQVNIAHGASASLPVPLLFDLVITLANGTITDFLAGNLFTKPVI